MKERESRGRNIVDMKKTKGVIEGSKEKNEKD